jgi:hypothetical protein
MPPERMSRLPTSIRVTPAKAAKEHGITLEIIKSPEAKRGFVLLPRRWVVERPSAALCSSKPQYSPQVHNTL